VAATPLISIVDDDQSMRASLEGFVRSLGHHVRSFPSAELFLGSEVRVTTACIISDLQMPGGMSGVEMAERLAANGNAPPVILISAFADASVHARAARAGVLCVLKKPFDGDELINWLDRALAA
jgi:FixJ family two-component response regulator